MQWVDPVDDCTVGKLNYGRQNNIILSYNDNCWVITVHYNFDLWCIYYKILLRGKSLECLKFYYFKKKVPDKCQTVGVGNFDFMPFFYYKPLKITYIFFYSHFGILHWKWWWMQWFHGTILDYHLLWWDFNLAILVPLEMSGTEIPLWLGR